MVCAKQTEINKTKLGLTDIYPCKNKNKKALLSDLQKNFPKHVHVRF